MLCNFGFFVGPGSTRMKREDIFVSKSVRKWGKISIFENCDFVDLQLLFTIANL